MDDAPRGPQGHEALPPDLRAALDQAIQKMPGLRAPADALLARHAAATSAAERARVEKLLRGLITPSRGPNWALVAFLVVTAGFVGWKMWSQEAHYDALTRSDPAVARVVRMEPGHCFATPKKKRCLRLELEVYRDGGAPYTGSLTHEVAFEWTARVQPGAWITVGVDPEDPDTILFNEAAMKVPPPPAPTGAQ